METIFINLLLILNQTVIFEGIIAADDPIFSIFDSHEIPVNMPSLLDKVDNNETLTSWYVEDLNFLIHKIKKYSNIEYIQELEKKNRTLYNICKKLLKSKEKFYFHCYWELCKYSIELQKHFNTFRSSLKWWNQEKLCNFYFSISKTGTSTYLFRCDTPVAEGCVRKMFMRASNYRYIDLSEDSVHNSSIKPVLKSIAEPRKFWAVNHWGERYEDTINWEEAYLWELTI